MRCYIIFIFLFTFGCKYENNTNAKPMPNTLNRVTNHTSIIDLPSLKYTNNDTLNVFLAAQFHEDKPFIKPLIDAWFKGTVIENMDNKKVIKLKCYRANEELYKIASKDFLCTAIQRDSILQKIQNRCFFEMKYVNSKIVSTVYDSSFMKH